VRGYTDSGGSLREKRRKAIRENRLKRNKVFEERLDWTAWGLTRVEPSGGRKRDGTDSSP